MLRLRCSWETDFYILRREAEIIGKNKFRIIYKKWTMISRILQKTPTNSGYFAALEISVQMINFDKKRTARLRFV